MGKWTVTEDTLTYTFGYTNGFKRTIRKSQIAIATLPNGQTRYSSSQSPFIQLADTSVSITSYTAGLSTIGFTNNGGDDWDIEFKIAPTSVQLPTGYSVIEMICSGELYNSGSVVWDTGGEITATTDTTVNVSGQGAGVYSLICEYVVSDGVNNTKFETRRYIKVDASGNILAEINVLGTTVNSVSGLIINVTADITFVNCSYPIQWVVMDSSYTPTLLTPTGLSVALALPANTAFLLPAVVTDSIFSDLSDPNVLAIQSISIS